jgi:hypothetical protein
MRSKIPPSAKCLGVRLAVQPPNDLVDRHQLGTTGNIHLGRHRAARAEVMLRADALRVSSLYRRFR